MNNLEKLEEATIRALQEDFDNIDLDEKDNENEYTKQTDDYKELVDKALNSKEDDERIGLYLLLITVAKRENKKVSFADIQTGGNLLVNDEDKWLEIMKNYLK